MTAAAHTTHPAGADDTVDPAERVLAEVTTNLDAIIAAEVRQFELAVTWAQLHPGDAVDLTVPWAERELQVAGDGAPTIAEFAIAEFALAAGISTDAARALIGDALEIRHRLPHLWDQVLAGRVRVWKARKIAQATKALSPDAAAHVDRHLATKAHRCSYAQIERTVAAAIAEHDPDQVEEKRARDADHTHFTVHTDRLTDSGLVRVDGMLELTDALALDTAITTQANLLLETNPDLGVDQRRAMATGQLGHGDNATEIVIYAHTRPDTDLVEVENTRSVTTLDQLVEWCGLAGARVTLKPVVDLTQDLHTDRYEPTPAQHEQAILTNPTCVFPRCSRPARGCDLDHITPWPIGPTASHNLAPLCRGHHRLKTHSDWTYTRTGPTTFLWTSPSGRRHPR